MKYLKRILIACLCLTLLNIPATVFAAAKTGLFTEDGKIYYYQNGKKVKNQLVKVKSNQIYFFGGDGAALVNKWRKAGDGGVGYHFYFGENGRAYISPTVAGQEISFVTKKVGTTWYGFDNKGHRTYGTYVSKKGLLYYFNPTNGVYYTNKSKALRAAIDKYLGKVPDSDEYKDVYNYVKKTLGNPVNVRKSDSCLPWNTKDKFTDYELEYENFIVLLIYNNRTKQYRLYDIYSK